MKVAVFGKPGGARVPDEEFLRRHAEALAQQRWVTKRFLKSPFVKPLGWPKNSPMLKSTISSYRFLRLSGRFWTPALKAKLLAFRPGKRVYVVRRQSDVKSLLAELEQQAANGEAQ